MSRTVPLPCPSTPAPRAEEGEKEASTVVLSMMTVVAAGRTAECGDCAWARPMALENARRAETAAAWRRLRIRTGRTLAREVADGWRAHLEHVTCKQLILARPSSVAMVVRTLSEVIPCGYVSYCRWSRSPLLPAAAAPALHRRRTSPRSSSATPVLPPRR